VISHFAAAKIQRAVDDQRSGQRESTESRDKQEKTSSRQPSTSDRYDHGTGRRLPEKASTSTSDPLLIRQHSTSDLDEDASVVERSRQSVQVKSVKSAASDQRKESEKTSKDSDRRDEASRGKGKAKGKSTHRRSALPNVRISHSRQDNDAVQRFLDDRRRHAKR
jgi:hypothetical protein